MTYAKIAQKERVFVNKKMNKGSLGRLLEYQLLPGIKAFFMVVVTTATIMDTRIYIAELMAKILQQETEVWVPLNFIVIIVTIIVMLQKIVRGKGIQKYGENNTQILKKVNIKCQNK